MTSLASTAPLSKLGLGSLVVCLALFCTSDRVAGQQSNRTSNPPADLVLRNGVVLTVEEAAPRAECLAIRGDRIAYVGDEAGLQAWIGPKTHVIDLGGRVAIPGFIEGHGHFTSLGYAQMILDLSTARSWQEVIERVATEANDPQTPAGTWIVGRGWHQEHWTETPQPNVDGYPVHSELSRRTPRHPVLLTHGTGHMVFANAQAMKLAGITASSVAPAGGEILRDADGQPTGVFRENAADRLYRTQATQRTRRGSGGSFEQAVQLAGETCLRHGITSFQDAGTSLAEVDAFRELAEQGKLPLRLWVMLNESNDVLARYLPQYRTIGDADHFLSVKAIKRMADGALGTHGAWLLEPYDDLPGSQGLRTLPLDSLRRTAELALEHGFQLCVHAIGDRANREVLDVFEEYLSRFPPEENGRRANPDLRWRIEHAQHLHPNDIPRFAQLGVIASMQGVHCTSDAPFVIQRLGQRRAKQGAYAWRSLLDHDAVVINGTDAPVEAVDPLASFYASVTRRLDDGVTFFPEQSMTREEALRSYTLAAAYAAGEESLKGSLKTGKLADIAILSDNLLTVPDDQLPRLRVVATILAGAVVWRDTEAFPPPAASPVPPRPDAP